MPTQLAITLALLQHCAARMSQLTSRRGSHRHTFLTILREHILRRCSLRLVATSRCDLSADQVVEFGGAAVAKARVGSHATYSGIKSVKIFVAAILLLFGDRDSAVVEAGADISNRRCGYVRGVWFPCAYYWPRRRKNKHSFKLV
jgi:hypothetical protein